LSHKFGGENLSPKLGEIAPDFAFRFEGIEATAALTHGVVGFASIYVLIFLHV